MAAKKPSSGTASTETFFTFDAVVVVVMSYPLDPSRIVMDSVWNQCGMSQTVAGVNQPFVVNSALRVVEKSIFERSSSYHSGSSMVL